MLESGDTLFTEQLLFLTANNMSSFYYIIINKINSLANYIPIQLLAVHNILL